MITFAELEAGAKSLAGWQSKADEPPEQPETPEPPKSKRPPAPTPPAAQPAPVQEQPQRPPPKPPQVQKRPKPATSPAPTKPPEPAKAPEPIQQQPAPEPATPAPRPVASAEPPPAKPAARPVTPTEQSAERAPPSPKQGQGEPLQPPANTGDGGHPEPANQPERVWKYGDELPNHDSWKDTPAEPGYVYHATNEERVGEIQGGHLRPHRPWHGTEQDVWPDGSTAHRSYFAGTPSSAWSFAPEEGRPALLRLKQNRNLRKESTGDFYLEGKKVSANRLEILTNDGWRKLASRQLDKQPLSAEPSQYSESGRRTSRVGPDDLITRSTVHQPPVYEGVNDVYKERVAPIAEAMKRSGWEGDPIVVIPEVEQALTGSHRLAAARQAGLRRIPVVEVSKADIEKAARALGLADSFDDLHVPDNETWLDIIRETGNEAAAELLEREIDKPERKVEQPVDEVPQGNSRHDDMIRSRLREMGVPHGQAAQADPVQIAESVGISPEEAKTALDRIAEEAPEPVVNAPVRGGGRAAARAEEAAAIEVTDDPVAGDEGVERRDHHEIEARMTDDEREEMEQALEDARQNWVDEQLGDYDPDEDISDRDRRACAASADWADEDVLSRAIKTLDDLDWDSLGVDRQNVENEMKEWYRGTAKSGEDAVDELVRALRRSGAPREVIDAVDGLSYDAREAVEERLEARRQELTDAKSEELADRYDSGDDRVDYLRNFYNDHEDDPRFGGGEKTYGKWGRDADGARVFNFETSGGRDYEIFVVGDTKIGEVEVPRLGFSDENNSFAITGRGEAHEVFAKTTAAALALLTKADLPVITFTAAEPSRQRLYAKLVQTLAEAALDYMALAVPMPGDKGTRYVLLKRDRRDEFEALAKAVLPEDQSYRVIVNQARGNPAKKEQGVREWLELFGELGLPPDLKDIAEHLDIDESDVRKIIQRVGASPAPKQEKAPAGPVDLRQRDPDHPVAKSIREDAWAGGIVQKLSSSRAVKQGDLRRLDKLDSMRAGLMHDARMGAKIDQGRFDKILGAMKAAEGAGAKDRPKMHEELIKLVGNQYPADIDFVDPRPPDDRVFRGMSDKDKKFFMSLRRPVTNPKQRAAIEKGLEFVRQLLPHTVSGSVVLSLSRDGRPGYNIVGGKPIVWVSDPGSGEHAASVVHELGHHLEMNSPQVKKAIREFVEYRFGDEKPIDMADVPGGHAMAGEMVRKDEFDRYFDQVEAYYVGRAYADGSTEIISMGLEALYRDPERFCQRDPEYAQFIFRVLRLAGMRVREEAA